jgi:hypothetical protein
MLCYNGLGNEQMAKAHQERYLRFKADEASQTITGKYRQLHPEDNNERQSIHEHESVPLNSIAQSGYKQTAKDAPEESGQESSVAESHSSKKHAAPKAKADHLTTLSAGASK